VRDKGKVGTTSEFGEDGGDGEDSHEDGDCVAGHVSTVRSVQRGFKGYARTVCILGKSVFLEVESSRKEGDAHDQSTGKGPEFFSVRPEASIGNVTDITTQRARHEVK
jgi:hypothetical protein